MTAVRKVMITTLLLYSLTSQGKEFTTHRHLRFMKGTSFYIIAGSIGGVIAVLAILLLSIFCIKHRGEQMNMQRSSPVDLPDEYECTPYAVSGQKEEINNCVYSLVQNPRPATEAEYSEVQLTKPAISGASGEHKYDF
ncbi:uncharacterized protein LOC122927660 isoform X4 [Bufo gargarizans]|uniref:uncharacterized protein LOC122927660 isoform X4 n=1 Tax=Bufo gargarizans TaxID=30331 RepID=UPI001CF20525|nr:uncharacterized protein LOC122927660 isoform X4 [Bufo gargarizans]